MGSLAVAGRDSRLIRISHEDYRLITRLAQAEKRSRVAQLSAMIHEAAQARKAGRGEPDRAPQAESLSAEVQKVR